MVKTYKHDLLMSWQMCVVRVLRILHISVSTACKVMIRLIHSDSLLFQKSLRHQDVTLMRQFITMNDTIRSISKDQRSEKTRKKRLRNKTLVSQVTLNQTMPNWQIPLVRQQSVPRFCDVIPEARERTWSCSSGGKQSVPHYDT